MSTSDDPVALPVTLARAWGVEPPGDERRRGPKASLTIDEIVDVAVTIADEQGYERCSLTSVAGELRVTTNALYRYLASRSELDVLMGERALGDPPVLSGDWRQAIRDWVAAMRQRHVEHPWLIDVQGYVPLLPRVLGWLDTLLDALTSGGLSTPEALRAATTIDAYVRSAAVQQQDARRAAERPDAAMWFTPDTTTTIADLARERGLDQVAVVLTTGLFASSALWGDTAFDEGLELLLEALEHRRSTVPLGE